MTKLRNAFDTLNSVCDGAQSEDGMGFNKFDASFARSLETQKEWSDKQKKAVYKMLKKYRNQLSDYNIDYEDIELDIESDVSNKNISKSNNENNKSKKSEKDKDAVIDYDEEEDLLRVKFDYNPKLVKDVKKISGRSFDGDIKDWLIPLNKNSIKDLREFCKKHNNRFYITSDAMEEINKAKNSNPRKIEVKDNTLFIKFPYNPELVSKVKQLPERDWKGEKKRWEISVSSKNCKKVIEFGKKNKFDISDEVIEKCEECQKTIKESKSLESDIEVEGLGNDDLNLRPFQRAGVEYGVNKERVLIADEVGLGKTVESLAIVQKKDSYPLLVICPATVKLNWKRECNKWVSNKDVIVINGRESDSFDKSDIYIINYDILHHNKEELKEINFESVIVDEFHKVKNHKAKRTKATKELVKELEIPVRLGLSATPIKNRPKELISQLDILGRLDDMGGFWNFANKYCNAHKTRWGMDMDGSSNLEELHERLRETCYVRREKKDVLPELPDIVRTEVPLEIDNWKEYMKAKYNIINYIRETEGEEKSRKALEAEVLVRLNKLKRITAEGKLKSVKSWVKDFLDSNEKLVLFAHHKSVVKDIVEEFNALEITGDTSKEEKQKAIDEFQNNPDEKLIVISLQAGSEGITLTKSSNIVFVELGWTSTEHDQAEGRCYGRLNDVHGVNSWYLIGNNTIDEEILNLIEKKREIIDKSVRGVGSENEDDVVSELIDKLKKEK